MASPDYINWPTNQPYFNREWGSAHSCVGAWCFNPNWSDNRIQDLSGHGNHGSFDNLNRDDYLAKGFDFGAYDDTRRIDCAKGIAIDGCYTLHAIINANSDDSGRILTRHNSSPNYGLWLLRNSANDIFGLNQSWNGTNFVTAQSGANACPINTWVTITATYDRHHIRLYVNGVEDTGGTAPLAETRAVNVSTGRFAIGAYDKVGTLDATWGGFMKMALVCYTALDSDTVANLAADPFRLFCRKEIAYFFPPAAAAGNRRRRLLICGVAA